MKPLNPDPADYFKTQTGGREARFLGHFGGADFYLLPQHTPAIYLIGPDADYSGFFFNTALTNGEWLPNYLRKTHPRCDAAVLHESLRTLVNLMS